MKRAIQVSACSKRYATITTSARILERVIATPIDLDAVRDYLINYHLDSVSERDRLPKLSKLSPNLWHRIRKFSEDNKLSNMMRKLRAY